MITVITEPLEINTVKNKIFYEVSTFGQGVYAKIFLKKAFENNDYELLTELYSPTFQGKTKIHLEESLQAGLRAGLGIDLPELTSPKKHTKTVRRFKIELSINRTDWLPQTPKYIILAGFSFMDFQKIHKPTLPLLLGKTVRDLAQTDFITFFFQNAATPTLYFVLKYENGDTFSYQKTYTSLLKYEPLTVPVGNEFEQYLSTQSLDNELVEVQISAATSGSPITVIPAVKPVKWTQAGDIITITLNQGSFTPDWSALNFPYYLQINFFWNESNHYQSFSLLGLIEEGNVSASTIIFDRIGSPIEDSITLANENIWLIATLTLQTAQAGGITTPINPPKSVTYGTWSKTVENSNTSEGFTLRLINGFQCPDSDNYLNFVYFNSFGGWESFLATGENETNLKIEQIGFIDAQNEILDNYNTEHYYELKAYSGYKEPLQIKQAHDFLISEKRFLSQNGQLIPISLTSNNINVDKSDSTLKYFEFSFRLAFDQIAPSL